MLTIDVSSTDTTIPMTRVRIAQYRCGSGSPSSAGFSVSRRAPPTKATPGAAPGGAELFCLIYDLRDQQEQIGVTGLLAGGGQHRVHLPAVMGLVIKEMGYQQPMRGVDLAVGGPAKPCHVLIEPRVVNLHSPARDVGVGLFANRAEHGKIVDQSGALLDRDIRLWPIVKARHPLLVAPQQMVEGAVDRSPKRGCRRSASESRAAARYSRRFISALYSAIVRI